MITVKYRDSVYIMEQVKGSNSIWTCAVDLEGSLLVLVHYADEFKLYKHYTAGKIICKELTKFSIVD